MLAVMHAKHQAFGFDEALRLTRVEPAYQQVATQLPQQTSDGQHDAVLRASHDPLLVMMARPVFPVLRTRFLRDRADQSFWADVDDDQVRIVEAIAAGAVHAADTAMRRHLETLRALYGSLDGAGS